MFPMFALYSLSNLFTNILKTANKLSFQYQYFTIIHFQYTLLFFEGRSS